MNKKSLAVVLALGGAISLLCGCGSSGSSSSVINPDASIKLKFVYENKGYGDEWIKEEAAQYEATHKDVSINVVSKASMTFEQDFSLGDNSDIDLYACSNMGYQTYIAKGATVVKGHDTAFRDLSSLYDKKNPYDDDGKTIKEKLSSAGLIDYAGYHYENTSSVKYYMLPYAGGSSGLLYNSDLIKDASSINTTDKLVSYVQSGTSEGQIAAIMWSTEGIDYMEYVMDTWIAQYEGKAGFDSIYDLCYDKNWGAWDYGTQERDGILESYKVAEKIIQWEGKKGTYSATDFNKANSDFKNGYAAIMPCGNWFASELLKRSGQDGFDISKSPIRYLKTPILSAIIDTLPKKSITDDETLSKVVAAIDEGKSSYSGVAAEDFDVIKQARSVVYSAGFNQQMYIPSSSKNYEAVEDFLLFFASKQGSKIFTEKTSSLNSFASERQSGASDFVKSFEDATIDGCTYVAQNSFASRFAASRTIARYNDPTIVNCAGALQIKSGGKYTYDAKAIYDKCLAATKSKVEAA